MPILFSDVNLGTVVNPLLLVVLMGAIVVDAATDGHPRGRMFGRRTPEPNPC